MDIDDDFEDLFEDPDVLEAFQAPLTSSATVTTSRDQVIERLETTFASLARSIRREEILAIALSRRPKSLPSAQSGHAKISASKSRNICFPGKTAEEAWRFTVVLRIMHLIYEALLDDVVVSKRDIYYRDPALFGKQAHVDRYVDDIAYTFAVPRASLNVTAVAKGLLAGALKLLRKDGSTIDASADTDGLLVPSMRDILSAELPDVKWVLVVEKEATFRSIAASSFWQKHKHEVIIVTAKGYPDIATRAMLRFVATASPRNGFKSPSVYALVDYDPDGLAIMSVYKYGSIGLAHENAVLRVAQLQWLGLRRDDITLLELGSNADQGLLTLSIRDRRKAAKMLERCNEPKMRAALQEMLLLNLKAELQIIGPQGMEDLLALKLGGL